VHVAEVNTACTAIRGMLEGFIREDKAGTIAMLNKVRPIDVIEHVMGRRLTVEESNAYLSAIVDIPHGLQYAFKVGKVWQDLKQTARKYLQGTSMESRNEIVTKFRIFLHGLESRVK